MKKLGPLSLLAVLLVACGDDASTATESPATEPAPRGPIDVAPAPVPIPTTPTLPNPATPPPPPSGGPTTPWPGSQLAFTSLPVQKAASNPAWGTALTDIVRHLPASYGTQYDFPDDLITWGHETTHGINSFVRNTMNTTGKKANGFYVMKDRAVILVEPALLLSDVAPKVPTSLRGSRFQLYLVNQTSGWNDTPSYVFDEWIAYTNGSEVGVELAKSGAWTTWRDGVAGTLEFAFYALALGAAVEQKDPTYFSGYPQFRELIAWNAERAMTLYRAGAVLPVFSYATQDALYTQWKTSADAAPLRNFARRTFGGDYVTKVLEIAPALE